MHKYSMEDYTNTHLGILKISMIDWCHMPGSKQHDRWHLLTDVIMQEFENTTNPLDLVFIERVNESYFNDFLVYLTHCLDYPQSSGYKFSYWKLKINFVQSTFTDKRMGEVGGSIVISKNNEVKLTDSIDLPSSKPQFDNGQPGKLLTFTYANCEFIIGCVPQNLGRDGDAERPYIDMLDHFWTDRQGEMTPSIFPVAVWDEGAGRYNIHVWQTHLSDAIQDDEAIETYIYTRTLPCLTLVEGLGDGTDVITHYQIASIIMPHVNPMVMYTNSPDTFTITHKDRHAVIPEIPGDSLVQYISINIKNLSMLEDTIYSQFT